MVAAERHAGKPPIKGIYEWSPMLEKVGQTITYWKLHLNQVQEGYMNPERIKMLKDKLNITDEVPKKKSAVIRKLKDSWKEIRKIQKGAAQHREKHLELLADFYAQQRNTTKTQDMNIIIDFCN